MNSISKATDKLRKHILRLEQGFPQDWIHIERKIEEALNSEKREGVKAASNHLGLSISEVLRKDILNVYNQEITKIRPIIGPNGAGKTTLLKFIAKDISNQIAPNSNIYLFFDFKKVTDDIKEFWSIFMQKLILQITKREGENIEHNDSILSSLLDSMDPAQRNVELMNTFKNPTLMNNLLKLNSEYPNDQTAAMSYFYDKNLDTKTISDFFYGLIQLALRFGYLVILAFDELQFLDEVDKSKRLLKLFLEQFIRHLMEEYPSQKLYILTSCLQNPHIKEWSTLKDKSRNFASIVQDKEIILGNLTGEEKDKIINQVANKIGFDKKNQKQFFSKVKGSLMYYLPRDLLRHIAKVLDTMDFVGYTKFEIRKIYEQDARNYMSKILKDKDFIHIEPEPKEIGGYEIDILATQGTKRAGYIPKAFGEVTMIKRSGAKGKAEKFSNWLLRMRGREYKPEDGDIAFFVCPPGSVTKGTQDILKANDIKLYKFDSANVEELLKQKAKKEPKGEIETEVVPPRIQEEEEEIVIIKQSKYNLQDVPGIGPTYAKKLKDAGIHTVKDLLECNAKMKVKEIYGVGETRINNWKQNARQIMNE